jgi:hypothetical protein
MRILDRRFAPFFLQLRNDTDLLFLDDDFLQRGETSDYGISTLEKC